MLRVGLVGCGRVAHHHVRFVKERSDACVVGVVDSVRQAADAFALKYNIPNAYQTIHELLNSSQPDVVHITTPPAYHYCQAADALRCGTHVLVEKPATLEPETLANLYELARSKHVTLCPDFIQLFHPRMLELRKIVESGVLGRVVTCEVHVGLDLSMCELREGKGTHWSFELPGGLLHNYVSHPLYLALHWTGEPRTIYTLPRSLGALPQQLTDHLDMVVEGEHATAHVVLTCGLRPFRYSVEVACEDGVVSVDFNRATVTLTRPSRLPRLVSRALGGFIDGFRVSRMAAANLISVARGKLVPYHGLRMLIDAYYSSIQRGAEPPVSEQLAIAVARAEERILNDCPKRHLDTATRPSRQVGIRQPLRILVTGATGYIGKEFVRRLCAEGYAVRALVRATSRIDDLENHGIECMFGDIRDFETVVSALEGVDVVVHLAAGLSGSADFMLTSCVHGTENLAKAAQLAGPQLRVIYISSQSVYDFATSSGRLDLNEGSPLDPQPEQRGAASMAKLKAEIVASHELDGTHPWTILRPSVVFGAGRELAPRLGFRLGNVLFCLGRRRQHLRLIHVHDLAAAIISAIRCPNLAGKVFNISHGDAITLKQYFHLLRRSGKGPKIVVYVPRLVLLVAFSILRMVGRLRGRVSGLNSRRVSYVYASTTCKAEAFRRETGWLPSRNLELQLTDDGC